MSCDTLCVLIFYFFLFFVFLFMLVLLPSQDFLFPRSPQPSYSSSRTVDIGRPLFPPVRQLSFHSPVKTCPDNSLDTNKVQHMPPVNTTTSQALPSADGLHKLQLTESPAGTELRAALKNPPRWHLIKSIYGSKITLKKYSFCFFICIRMDYQRNVHPLSAQQLRWETGHWPLLVAFELCFVTGTVGKFNQVDFIRYSASTEIK